MKTVVFRAILVRMVHIDIEVPRPLQTLLLIAAVVGLIVWNVSDDPTDAEGGTGVEQAQVIDDAEEDVRRLRLEQQVLDRREEILRAEFEALEHEENETHDPEVMEQLRATRQSLLVLLEDRRAAEEEILQSLRQIWEAQGYAFTASRGSQGDEHVEFVWPIQPDLGISAHFDDKGYRQRFGLDHKAIDLPALQETIVVAAADGVVAKVTDNGMGFNSLVIRHAGGYATLYGHVTSFLVREGQDIEAGDPIALSGGRPGTPGAGRLTTGAHLHLELIKDGVAVDPLTHLPQIYGLE